MVIQIYLFTFTVPKKIDFPRYTVHTVTWNVVAKTWYYAEYFMYIVSCFPLHFMLYCWNLDSFFGQCTTQHFQQKRKRTSSVFIPGKLSFGYCSRQHGKEDTNFSPKVKFFTEKTNTFWRGKIATIFVILIFSTFLKMLCQKS